MPDVSILVKAKDEASKVLKGIGGSLGGLGGAFSSLGILGPLSLGAVAAGAMKLAYDAARLEPTRITFENLAESIDTTSESLLERLRPATMGMVDSAGLMRAANKLMAMGLAETEDEAADLAEMATKLGMAMGKGPTEAMEEFALMLANQSIPRLDTFGISAGKVRQRIEELMKADQSLTREQAFMAAVMEQGKIAMGKVGDISGTTAVKMAQVGVAVSEAKQIIGEALIPVLNIAAQGFLDLMEGSRKTREELKKWKEEVYNDSETAQEYAQRMTELTLGTEKSGSASAGAAWEVAHLRYEREYAIKTAEKLGLTEEVLLGATRNIDEEMAIGVKVAKDYGFGIQFTTEQMDALAKMQEKIAAGTFEWVPLRADLTKMWPEAEVDAIQKKIQLLIGQTTDMRIVGAGQALAAEKTSYDGELEAAKAAAEGVKTTWEDAKTRLDETRAGMHGVAGAYDVQAITSEGTALYELEWEAAQVAVEALEATHIERMGALTAGYAGAVANTTDPAIRKWQEYHATVEALNEIKTADAAQKAADAYLPPLEEMLAKLIMEHEIGWGAIEETMRAKVAESIPHVQELEGAQREVTLRVNETEGGVGDMHDEFVKKMPNIATNVKKGMEDPVKDALDEIKDYRTELDNLDGTKVHVYIYNHYIDVGAGPGAEPFPSGP